MKLFTVLAATVLLSAAAPPQESKTFTGVITETMCKRTHTMGVSPDAKCVRDCVGDGTIYKYALAVGDALYTLSDQETPAKFAAQKVEVTGVLYSKTNIIKVQSMKSAR